MNPSSHSRGQIDARTTRPKSTSLWGRTERGQEANDAQDFFAITLLALPSFSSANDSSAALSELVMFGKLPVSLQAGVGYWLESLDSGPEGSRFRLQANFVLPR